MQEMRHDGTEKLTANATWEQLKRAIEDDRNRAVFVHKPGSIITTMHGGHQKKFRVEEDGTLTRLHLKTLEPLRGPSPEECA
jgi:hypothetical protein